MYRHFLSFFWQLQLINLGPSSIALSNYIHLNLAYCSQSTPLSPRPVERGGSFPDVSRDVWGPRRRSKNTENGVSDGFFDLNMHKVHFRAPAGGAYDVPRTPSRMVRGHLSRRFLLRRIDLKTYRTGRG